MLLTALIVVWTVAVLAALAYTGLRGWGAYQAARALQRSVEPHIQALRGAGLTALASRSEELQRRLASLQAVLAHLNAALAALRVLLDAWRAATRPFSYLRGLVHR